MMVFGWGGYFYGGITELEEQLVRLHDAGWNAIRPYAAQPWRNGLHYTQEEIDYIVSRGDELGITVYLDLMHNYPPSDYLTGHKQEWIDFWVQQASRFNNRTNVVIEAINEWAPPNASTGYSWFQDLLDALRSTGIKLPILFNYSQWGGYMTIKALDDPQHNYMIGRHYYGADWDGVTTSPLPTDLDSFAESKGVTGWLRNHFEGSGGSAYQTRQLNVPYCVTELGCSYNYSNMCISGGYLMYPGNMAFVMKYLEYAKKYNANIILHRIGTYDDYHCYYQFAQDYFAQNFWTPQTPPPPPPPSFILPLIIVGGMFFLLSRG